jgi:CheY-like chemotaxis protein
MGFTELGLMRDTIDDTTREYLLEVNEASLRATDLVRQILTFSRQVEQEPKPLMVQLVVNEALKLLRSTLPSSIEIQTDIQKHTRPVIADPTHIHQVIMNLSTNAMHAMEPDGGLLAVEIHETEILENNATEVELMPGTYLKMRVTDTGCGIEMEDIERIFDPYFTTKDIGEGTGLGLSVVHGIIEDCGGKITVKSSAETGTSFTIYLPTVESSAAELVEEQDAILPRGQEHILVVDDEPFIRKLCKSILIKQGYRITTANNGKEALELFKRQPDAYDLVLSDVMMPKLRGESLAKQLMKLKSEQPVMLMTGYAEKLRRDELLGHGVMGLLQKPITRRTLICEVRDVLDKAVKKNR